MKARPILFSSEMIRALLDGRKAQTRRIVKPQPLNIVPLIGVDNNPTGGFGVCNHHHGVIDRHVRCPQGRPGDLLWVRETWGDCTPGADAIVGTIWVAPWYRADADEYGLLGHDGDGPVYVEDVKWRPSIHMPRRHSRITLLIEDVRVERLNSISAADCWAEGIPHSPDVDPYHEYAELWAQLHGPDSWLANPFVWRIQFRPILQQVDAYMREAA